MDQQQFRELALRELPAVYRMARHLTRADADAADDLVQQTYLNALRAADSFRLTASGIRPWLFKILHNLYRSRLAQQARQPVSIDDADDRPGTNGHAAVAHVDLANLDWDQVDERLKHAIAALPEQMRSIFLLTAVEGMKYRQVGQILGLPIGTVMSTLFRARSRLLKMLSNVAAERKLDRKTRTIEQKPSLECYPRGPGE